MIREVHVYGPAVSVGDESQGEAQHIGLGSQRGGEGKRDGAGSRLRPYRRHQRHWHTGILRKNMTLW
ncbi:MAG: hypothetical protein M5U34_48660 [Chloroflexi bacterium]|nr:hypothetical protein [Chloroflexota bacterium]